MKAKLLASILGLFSYSLATHAAISDLDKTTAIIWGLTGQQTAGEFQILSPLYLTQNFVFFGGAEGKLSSDNGWLAGIGGGARKIIQAQIYGGYLLADFNRTPNNNKFWVVNPGIESFGKNWEWRVNGYIPLKNKLWLDKQDLAENFGSNQDIDFISRPHAQYDHILKLAEEPGTGLDAEIGHAIPLISDMKLFVGGYYFDTKDFSKITGGEGRISYQVNRYTTLELRDSYDNAKHNKFLCAIRLTLGGLRENTSNMSRVDIHERLLDPIEHNFATAAAGNSVPLKQQYLDTKQTALVKDHLWFFDAKQSASNNQISGDGTYLHPYTGISADIVNQIKNNPLDGGAYANFYFNGNNRYTLKEFVNQRLALPINYNIYGKIANYLTAASGNSRPIFIGGLNLEGNSNIDSIMLKNDGIQDSGILVSNNNRAPNILLHNILVGEDNAFASYRIGVAAQSTTKLTIDNSIIYSYSNNVNHPAYGIQIDGGTITMLTNNIISSFVELKNDSSKPNATKIATGIGLKADAATINIRGNNNAISGNVNFENFNITSNEMLLNAGIGISGENAKILIFGHNNQFIGAMLNNKITISGTAKTAWSGGSGILGNGASIAIYGHNNQFIGSMLNNKIIMSGAAETALLGGNGILGNGANILIYGHSNQFIGAYAMVRLGVKPEVNALCTLLLGLTLLIVIPAQIALRNNSENNS